MNYLKHYQLLMNKARTRNLEGYFEKHRELPGCMGGTYNSLNVVKLTPEEHYTAHLLLIKIYPKEYKLVYAAKMMTIGDAFKNRGRKNKLYGWLRRRFAKQISIDRKKNPVIWTKEMRKAQSERKLGIPGHKQTTLTKQKISISHKLRPRESFLIGAAKTALKNKGKKRSLETRLKMSAAHDHKPRIVSQESREKAKLSKLGYKPSEETKLKTSLTMKGVPKIVVSCPHCGKTGGKPAMVKYHFNKCKTYLQNISSKILPANPFSAVVVM